MWIIRARHIRVRATASLTVALVTVAPAGAQTARGGAAPAETALTGQVTSTAEGPMEGVVVTAKRHGSTIATSVISDADGRYYFPAGRLQVGPQTLSVRAMMTPDDQPTTVAAHQDIGLARAERSAKD